MHPKNENPPLIPIALDLPGRYELATTTNVRWHYAVEVDDAGARFGSLRLEGADLPAVAPGDRVVTPWGTMRLADNGFWLDHAGSAGKLLPVPDVALTREGTWKGAAGAWKYTVSAFAMGSKSERRVGGLEHRHLALTGVEKGDVIKTPWGAVHWMGPADADAIARYEQGFLLYGTYDRPLDDMPGRVVRPEDVIADVRLVSLYLEPPAKLTEVRAAHGIRLVFRRMPKPGSMAGTLLLDPNACSLNAFGDREVCTKIATQAIGVTVTQMRLADPRGLGRAFFEIRSDEVPLRLALVQYPDQERYRLVHEGAVVPLFFDDEG
jgi:hypothetical protein